MKYRKAVCIYPYLQEVPIYEFFPPIGLEYIAASIQDLVEKVVILDFRFESDLSEIRAADVDLFCVSVNWHYEFDSVLDIIKALPKGPMTVVGGKFATENVDAIFERCPNVAVIVRGDGEETMRELLRTGSPEGVQGLSFRKDGAIVHNGNRDLKVVSDTLFPDRRLRRRPYRVSYQRVDLGYSFDSMIGSRGCPFKCKFCSFNRNPLGQKREYSERTPESIVAELKQIDAEVVAFLDDNFFVNLKRVEKLCDLLIKENLGKKFIVNARVTVASNPKLLRKLEKAGFRLLMIGLESAQDKSLKSLNKGFKTETVKESFKTLRRAGMLTSGYFIVGLIGETREEMIEIAPYSREIGVDFIHLNRLRYEKYSGLAEMLADNKEYYVGDKDRIYSRKYGPDEIRAILKSIRNQFFSPQHLLAVMLKAIRVGFPSWRIFLRLPVAVPMITWRLINRKKHRLGVRKRIDAALAAGTGAGLPA